VSEILIRVHAAGVNPIDGAQRRCGPDGDAATLVERLIADVGLRPVRLGGQDTVGVLDGVARLWFALALGQEMGRRVAFKVLIP
jgi:predicted dinucleotide-binding enzyme